MNRTHHAALLRAAALCLALCCGLAVAAPSPDARKAGASSASSFAPDGHSHRRVYGTPIQPPIVRKRAARRHKPALRSAPLS